MSVPEMDSGSWAVWSMHVLEELKRLNLELRDTNEKFDTNINSLRRDMEDMRIAFIEFKTTTNTEARVKNGMYGAISGAVISVILIVINYLATNH